MCPKPNETDNLLSKKSHVEDLEKVAGLFKALTDEPDHMNRWTSMTFPVDFNFTHIGVKKETKLMLRKYCLALDSVRFTSKLLFLPREHRTRG